MAKPAAAAARRYRAADLVEWITAICERCSVARADALLAANVLVRTSLRGIDTHGIARFPGYVEQLKSGELNPQPSPRFETRAGVLQFDGDLGLGQVVGTQAVRATVAAAENAALATCFIRRSGHLGALGQLILEAAERGLVAFICQKTAPVIALEGSRRRAIGNNPLAFAMPVAGKPPLVFDMATSVVAYGNIRQALRDKTSSLPPGWAIGPDGAPTRSLERALKGALLPIAGHKGIGLAMLVECLAGSLGAIAGEPQQERRPDQSHAEAGVSAFLMVMNPAQIAGRSAFDEHVARWLAEYMDATGPAARYPGQRQAKCELERSSNGIPLADSSATEFVAIGRELRVGFDLTAVREADRATSGSRRVTRSSEHRARSGRARATRKAP